jgi:general secretion pathway protein G
VILTLVVLGILAVIVCPKIFARRPYMGLAVAQTQMATFNAALGAFRSDTGYYPQGTNGLLDLIRQPLGATNWRGPYLDKLTEDPWGRAYVYNCPSKHPGSGCPYDLMCLGPPGENAPIANWSSDQMKTRREPGGAQPDGAANGSLSIRSETNRTSPAAGSRP